MGPYFESSAALLWQKKNPNVGSRCALEHPRCEGICCLRRDTPDNTGLMETAFRPKMDISLKL